MPSHFPPAVFYTPKVCLHLCFFNFMFVHGVDLFTSCEFLMMFVDCPSLDSDDGMPTGQMRCITVSHLQDKTQTHIVMTMNERKDTVGHSYWKIISTRFSDCEGLFGI
jgi:hypothetical protein